MLSKRAFLLLSACVTIVACSKSGAGPASPTSDPIASAQSAAPPAISHDAQIITQDAAGHVKVLRNGRNGWTCMPDSPLTPGPDPMCWDSNAGKWLDALMAHKIPSPAMVGIIYMLAGGSDAGNTDPYAQKPHAGEDWVTTGPHIMVVGSKEILVGYPSGIKPNTAAPYVMWQGTPYAHLMVPAR